MIGYEDLIIPSSTHLINKFVDIVVDGVTDTTQQRRRPSRGDGYSQFQSGLGEA